MSLQLVANHLAQKGRGPDSTLVHMSNKEVAGLQALAKRHGGELSVNPDTGLPEAGFLDSILPTIAGAGLTYFSGGAISPLMAAGIVGGISALDSKDLSKGLMAGLGAYGGAGLTTGLMTAGTGALTQQGIEAAGGAEALGAVPGGATGIAENVAGASNFDRLSAGAGQLFSNPGQAMQAIGGGSGYQAAGILGAAAAPMLADEMVETTTEAPEQSRGMIRPYTYSRQQAYPTQDYQGNMGSKERRYFNEGYTAGDPYAAAGGGLVALARGGYAGATSSSVVGTDSPYYQSPEYKAYMAANSDPFGQIGTADMYDSPYFGTVGSGSLGKQNDRAYEAYLGRLAQENTPTNPPISPLPPGQSVPPQENTPTNPPISPPSPGQSMPPRESRPTNPPISPPSPPNQSMFSYGVNPQSNLGRYNRQSLFKPTTPLPENNMYGASRDAYDYLMGVNPTSGGGQTRPYDPNYSINDIRIDDGKNLNPNTPNTGKGRYEFDPVTKQYKWVPDPITPVDVAAPVFENPMQSGGGGGGGYGTTPEGRAEREAQMDKLRAELGEEGYAKRNDFIGETLGTVGKFLNPLGFLDIFRGLPLLETTPEEDKAAQDLEATNIRDIDGNLVAYKSPTDQFAGYQPNSPVPGGVPTPTITAAPEGMVGSAAPQGDPAQQQAARDARIAAFDASRESSRGGGGGGGMGGDAGGGRDAGGSRDAGGERGYSGNNSGDNRGWGSRDAGGGDARGGYLQHGQFDQRMAHGGIANLHQYNLGSYSDGGRLLKGPGDGVSDDIPATIGRGQPARLADGEFVIPARIVSELGNGSTDAGARALYKMMDRIQAGRKKTVGKNQVAKNSKSVRHLPA